MKRILLSVVLLFVAVQAAPAHFVWIIPGPQPTEARFVFSDSLEPDDQVSIDKIAKTKAWLRDAAGKDTPITLTKGEHFLGAKLPAEGAVVVAGTLDYGVLKKGDAKPFLLAYHAKWVRGDVKAATASPGLPLEIVAQGQGRFRVLYAGKPAAKAEVITLIPGDKKETATSDDKGEFTVKASTPGLYGIRARVILADAGEQGGKKYEEVKHYATLVYEQPKVSAAAEFPPLPEAFSSFGAAVEGGFAYVYGGHIGKTHTYSTEAVTGKFRRLNLGAPSKGWEELPAGPPLQGLALVAHGGKLYRIGGMQPRNKVDEPADTLSTAECAVFDPKVGKWQAFPELPAGRSSHDAVVVGNKIVVVGGWQLKGRGNKSAWLDDSLVLDLSQQTLRWQSIQQPFRRRALTASVLDGKVYAFCGLSADGGTEMTVDVLDVASGKWSKGPDVPGATRNGFTPASCSNGQTLFVSPADGKVYRLSSTRDRWEESGLTLQNPRVVHRMVPIRDNLLLVLGGASRGANVAQSEAIQLGVRE